MLYIKRFILMVQFLTRIPIKLNLKVTSEDFGKGLVFAPVVGLLIGAFMYAIYFAAQFFLPFEASMLIALIAYIMMTGGLHLDGLGDTFDGVYSNRSKERILEIMRDSRIGTNALLAVVSVLLLDFILLKNVPSEHAFKVLLLFPVAGRIGSLMSSGISKYARRTDGLGKSFIDICGAKEMILGSLFYFGIFFIIGGLNWLLLAVVALVAAIFITRIFTSKIGGATGDILGAVCEINQVVYLIAFYVIIY